MTSALYPGVPFSTRNAVTPFARRDGSTVAKTVMTSAWSPFVHHCLEPLSTREAVVIDTSARRLMSASEAIGRILVRVRQIAGKRSPCKDGRIGAGEGRPPRRGPWPGRSR